MCGSYVKIRHPPATCDITKQLLLNRWLWLLVTNLFSY